MCRSPTPPHEARRESPSAPRFTKHYRIPPPHLVPPLDVPPPLSPSPPPSPSPGLQPRGDGLVQASLHALYALAFFLPLKGFLVAFLASFLAFADATFLNAGEFLRNSGRTISLI